MTRYIIGHFEIAKRKNRDVVYNFDKDAETESFVTAIIIAKHLSESQHNKITIYTSNYVWVATYKEGALYKAPTAEEADYENNKEVFVEF